MVDTLDIELDLVHLVATAADNALPPARMRAVLDRALERLSIAMQEHFAIEEEVADRAGNKGALAAEHHRLSERVRLARENLQSAPVSHARAELMELLDALGEHERAESDASSSMDAAG